MMKTVLITGGTAGIGLAATKLFFAEWLAGYDGRAQCR